MSGFDVNLTITGIQEQQNKNLKRIAALQPNGATGQAIKKATLGAHRYAVSITHVWIYRGGALRASHRAEIKGLRGRIYLDPSAVNPRSVNVPIKPSVYGFYENRRGGSHAFYDRTVAEYGGEVNGIVLSAINKEMQ